MSYLIILYTMLNLFFIIYGIYGTPAANTPSGISLVTTLPAPITQPFPIVTPPHTVTFPANQQLSPMVIGLAYSLSAYTPSSRLYIFQSLFILCPNLIPQILLFPVHRRAAHQEVVMPVPSLHKISDYREAVSVLSRYLPDKLHF